MKNLEKFLVAVGIVMSTSLVQAFPQTYGLEGTKIQCHLIASPSHHLTVELLENIPSEGAFDDHYSAHFHSLHGPRWLGHEYEVSVIASPILTRVQVGVFFEAEIEGRGRLQLQDVQQSWWEEKFPVSFTGSFISAQKEYELSCEYLVD